MLMSKQEKKGLVPERRFPEFLGGDEWEVEKVASLVSTVTPPKKLLSSDYLEEGAYPVIDQSQSEICGWTNDSQALINKSLPLIIFGDHTCALKLAEEPFAQGADGIKILKTKSLIETHYLYQFLQFNPLVMESYKRHFSTLKEKLVCFPDRETGEQQKIADCLTSIDELITAHTQKLDALKRHKKGLMQQLFPAEGETEPKLRFPEFRGKGEWKETILGKLVDIRSGFSPSKYSLSPQAKYAFLKVDDLNNCDKYQSKSREYSDDVAGLVPANSVIFPKRGAAIMLNKVRINFQDVLMDTNLMAITPNKKILVEFLYYKITSVGLFKIADTSTIPQINNKHIIPYQVLIPAIQEQQKIADCLRSIDELITAQAQKVESLKAHKKGLMQQLFPAMDNQAEANG